MLHRAVARLAACGCGPRLPLPPNILAFGARGARSATRKKLERDVNQRLSRVDSQRGSEDEGIFKGKITALMGSFMQVLRYAPSLPDPARPPAHRTVAGLCILPAPPLLDRRSRCRTGE
jgi:hypothetical protein